MSSFSSPPALLNQPENTWRQEGRSASFRCDCGQKPALKHTLSALARILILLISTQILSLIFCAQEAPSQAVTDREVTNLEQQFDVIQKRLISIDNRLVSLNKELNTATNEITRLKEEVKRSGGVFGRFRNIFRNRTLGKLSTRSQDLWNEIRNLEKEREFRVKQFILLADELIDKFSPRISVLMEVARGADLRNNIEIRDKALKQVSSLWRQTEKVTVSRNKYARDILDPKRTVELSPLLSSDPRELRLVAEILKNAASEVMGEVDKLEREIRDLERKKRILERMVELSRDIKRRSEERGTEDIDFEISDIPWGSERDIDGIAQEIRQLSDRKGTFEADAERYKTQSETLEQRASQIEAELKGKSEDD